jgi:hypothetical protein
MIHHVPINCAGEEDVRFGYRLVDWSLFPSPAAITSNLLQILVRPDLTKIQSPPRETAKLNAAKVSLTRGRVNAVRSAFKAGITPSRIAREFGIPLSDVRRSLAADKTKR